MPSSSRGFISSILLGGFSLVGISLFIYFLFFNKPSLPLLADAPKAPAASPRKTTAPSVHVEDVEGSDDEEEEEEDESAPTAAPASSSSSAAVVKDEDDVERLQEIKEQYDTASRMGQKFIKAEEYGKAVEKLSEALRLAPQVPSASRDILMLYNNRSAMFEKLQRYEDSLRDITIVLTMDANHMKARVRRARVYEAQGKLQLALTDYFYVAFMERLMQQPPNHTYKIEELAKQLSLMKAQSLIKDLVENPSGAQRSLPSNTFVRNALEAYTTYPMWKAFYSNEFQKAVQEKIETEGMGMDMGLHKVRVLLVEGDFKQAFALLDSLKDYASNSSDNSYICALYYELTGLYSQLISDFSAALESYNKALQLFAACASDGEEDMGLFVKLKIAAVHMEKGDNDLALELYNSLLDSKENSNNAKDAEDSLAGLDLESSSRRRIWSNTHNSAVSRAYAYYHRASYYTTKNREGLFYKPVEDYLDTALKDLDLALADTAHLLHREDAKTLHFSSLLKSVHTLTHIKSQMGLSTTPEDTARNKESLEQAKQLYPHHDSLLILLVSALADEGESEKAFAMLDKHVKRAGNTLELSSVYVIKASILASKAFMEISQAQNEFQMAAAQGMFGEVCELYEKALSSDKDSLEVLCQYAQMKTLMGDTQGAVHLLKEAVPLIRSREEAYDVAQFLASNECQLAAQTELIKNNQQ